MKLVVKEATKEQKVFASLPRRSMRNPVSNGVTAISHNDVINDAIEIKSPTKLEEKFSPSRVQQSMRRSKLSGELERDMALPALQPRLPTATPLNPVTPLRWKSSKRLELEKKKLQEEMKAKEVVKDEKKNSKPAKEERKDKFSKMTALSKPDVNVMETSHKVDKDTRSATSASSSESMVLTQTNGKTTDLKSSPSTANGGSDERATNCEETSSLNSEQGIDRSSSDVSGADRKPLLGDESPVITIDFLRARLLAERASSKAAKERVQQLTKKVLELEERLDREFQSRKKAEEAAQDALLKHELLGKRGSEESSKIMESRTSLPENLGGPNQASETAISGGPSSHGKTKTEHEDHKFSDQVEEICQVRVEVDNASPNSTVVANPGHTRSVSLDCKDGKEQALKSGDKETSSPEQETGDRQGIQGLEKVGSQEFEQDTNLTAPRVVSTSCNSICSSNSGLERQQRRLAVEERLRHMWDRITEEMAALANDKTQEELVREELLNWMGQVPSVLQDILPKPSEDKKLVIESSSKKVQLKDGDVPPSTLNFDQAQNEDAVEDRSLNGASSGRVHDQGLKKVASLIERFEAQESVQRELEQSYAKKNSTGRRRSNEGSISRTNSNSGTPHSVESQQESQQEKFGDVAPNTTLQTEDPRHNGHATNSSVSPQQGKSADSSFLENGKVDMQTPEISTPSTYPDPRKVGEVVDQSSEKEITYGGTERSKDVVLKDAELGSERSLVPSFIAPRLHSTSSGLSAKENGGDIRGSQLVDRSLVLKKSNHLLKPRSSEETYGALRGHSGSSNIERGDPQRSQTLAGWVQLEDSQAYRVPANKADGALQWDASYIGLHPQHEKLASYSQAGDSNAYVRPEVPGTYPLRNDEREIYRGRMESVSRSMEGLGGSWRSLSDPEGDEILPYAEIPESNESETTGRPGLQMAFQVNGGSGRSKHYQAESMVGVGMSPNLAYPGREFSRDHFQSRTSNKFESSASKVNEVLKALQLAKLSIQKTGGRRTSVPNIYPTNEHSYSGGEKHNLTDYKFYGGDGMTNRSPVAIRVWSHQELSRRYSTGSFRDSAGSPPRLQHANSTSPFGMVTDARGKDPEEDHPLAGRSSPVANARRKLMDKISTGGRVQYFYPN